MNAAHRPTRTKSLVAGAKGALPVAISLMRPPSLAATFLHTSQSVKGEACTGRKGLTGHQGGLMVI